MPAPWPQPPRPGRAADAGWRRSGSSRSVVPLRCGPSGGRPRAGGVRRSERPRGRPGASSRPAGLQRSWPRRPGDPAPQPAPASACSVEWPGRGAFGSGALRRPAARDAGRAARRRARVSSRTVNAADSSSASLAPSTRRAGCGWSALPHTGQGASGAQLRAQLSCHAGDPPLADVLSGFSCGHPLFTSRQQGRVEVVDLDGPGGNLPGGVAPVLRDTDFVVDGRHQIVGRQRGSASLLGHVELIGQFRERGFELSFFDPCRRQLHVERHEFGLKTVEFLLHPDEGLEASQLLGELAHLGRGRVLGREVVLPEWAARPARGRPRRRRVPRAGSGRPRTRARAAARRRRPAGPGGLRARGAGPLSRRTRARRAG